MWSLIRVILFTVPVVILLASVWLVRQASQLEYRNDNDLVVAVSEQPALINPLVPSTGVTREVTEMVFDRLLRHDDELRLRGHLLESWDSGQSATYFFSSEEQAEAAVLVLSAGEGSKWGEWGVTDLMRDGDLVNVTLKGRGPEAAEVLVGVLGEKSVAKALELRLTLAKGAVRQSFDNFLTGSVEKGQIKLLRQPDDRTLMIYLIGEDTDLFIKELRLYYESNLNLEPVIDGGDEVAFSSEPELTMRLREGVTFHDGEPLTADDVVFTWNEVTRAGSISPMRDIFGPVVNVEAVDSRTIRAVYRGYYAPMMEAWAQLPILPKHVVGEFTTAKQWARFYKNPIGTGPMKLAARGAGQTVLESFEGYFRGAPRQPRTIYRTVDVHEDRVLALRLGTIDAVHPDTSELWTAKHSDRLTVLRDVSRFQTFVAWNTRESLFSDPKVRTALGLLVNVDGIVSAVAGPHAKAPRGIFYPGVPFCEDLTDARHTWSPDGGVQLLESVGWNRDPQGKWTDAKGAPVVFTITVDADNALQEAMAVELAFAWGEVGIEVDVERMAWFEMLSSRIAPRDFDAALLGWELGQSRDQWSVWHSSERGQGGGNFTGLDSPEVNRLLRQLRSVEKDEAVKEAATALQREIFDLQPMLFLCETGAAYAVRTGAVELARPRSDGKWQPIPVTVGNAGLMESRPWWVRTSVMEADAPE